MLKAQNQADQYVRALATEEGRPPFIVVSDVGRSIELYSEFSCSGGTYVPFPDPGHHRIRLEELRIPEIQNRLRLLWEQPGRLDPSKYSARVTREVSAKLATLARSLEQQGYDVQRVAHFLKRCLFTMFSEDVGLLPGDSFTHLLESQLKNSEHFSSALRALWDSMNTGGYSPILNSKVRRFNGGLFQGVDPIQLDSGQIQLLIDAGKADWSLVEPAIFGTLLERALDPRERHKLGAHFTPRAYVERLVMPTLIDPLRDQWRSVQVAAEAWLQQEKPDKALTELREFHHQLCQTRVLDPACGSGNFLYVSLEHMKRLEGEVVNLIRDLSSGQVSFDTGGLTVDPHQFLGLEINPRAAAIAEIVLWIGYLQWHYRIHGELDIPDPVLKDFRNIEHRDALLDYDSREQIYDDSGEPVSIWDGISFKKSLSTGELVPDETGRIPVYRYMNPQKAKWPHADFIVGNPPFIGDKAMRRALGNGYVDALRAVYSKLPESVDFVLYWWQIAAEKVCSGEAKQFGFITTNSLRQTFNRRVLEQYLNNDKNCLSFVFAIPDHPWVDSNDGAAVRIAMTVGAAGDLLGNLRLVQREYEGSHEEREVILLNRHGKLFADLAVGANVGGAKKLEANGEISSNGVMLAGSGFILDRKEAKELGLGTITGAETVIREYRNGRDLTQRPRDVMVIDLFGLTIERVRTDYPEIYQRVLERVKPERDNNRRKKLKENWWIFAEPRVNWRRRMSKNLSRYIATGETAKHRFFQFLDKSVLPDHMIIAIGLDDACYLGILSSRIHVIWALASGGRLGVGNDARYNKTRCFETFAFPELSESQSKQIRRLAEDLDTHRKRQQNLHPELAITDLYNVLEKIRRGEILSAKEQVIHKQGLVSILQELHDEIDNAVFAAYGWCDLADQLVGKPGATTPLQEKSAEQADAEEELLCRLVELNGRRVKEEARGHIHWLRPECQAPELSLTAASLNYETADPTPTAGPQGKQVWPKSMPDQVNVIRTLLVDGPKSLDAMAVQFKRRPSKGIEQVLSAFKMLGHAEDNDDLWHLK